MSEIASPTDVQMGDPFEITAFIQGNGLSGREVDIELLMKSESDNEPVSVERKSTDAPEDGLPVSKSSFRGIRRKRVESHIPCGLRRPNRVVETNIQDNDQSFSAPTSSTG